LHWRRPSQKAAHRVQLSLTLEATRKRDGSQGSRKGKEAERKETECEECAETKGRYGVC
jgi:hypothetical protein